MCKRYSTNVKNGAVFCACADLNSLGYRYPVQVLQYARPQDALITEAIAYMEKHFQEPITVQELAGIVGLSPYYFSRLFRKYTNFSPHAYLIDLRITFARDLLASSQHPIEQVAERCGFNSIQHFIRCFRQHIGCSPPPGISEADSRTGGI
ncbi:helix-turn-helix domain-containing protein [Butyricicoccus sp.]|uniref:helix-turn-helix domain-containing protein n=1 Tax=Butyricicoccus sp. TaxID=2049021 RepID=UPI003F14FB50